MKYSDNEFRENEESILEICDSCGEITYNPKIIDGSIICERCVENEFLESKEELKGKYCAICGWPINRVIKKDKVKVFLDYLEKWLSSKNRVELIGVIKPIFKDEKIYLCRYDFFELIEKIIEKFDENIAKEFNKKFTKNFDFQGSLIS